MITDSGFAERWMERTDRWSLVSTFLHDWHSPLSIEDRLETAAVDGAERSLGLRVPVALREWYETAGNKNGLFVQDQLLGPDELYVVHDYLVFFLENQSVVGWGVRRSDWGLEDPPVWIDLEAGWGHSTNKWVRQNSTLSEFLLQRLVSEAPFWAPWGGSGIISATAADAVEQQFEDLGLPYCRWPLDPTKHLAGRGLLVELCRDRGKGYASAAAASLEAVERARSLLPIHWESGPRVIPE